MTEARPIASGWHQRPAYKYGMLAVIAVALAMQTYGYVLMSEASRKGALMGFITGGLLLFNHIVWTFLDQPQQRRILPLQGVLTIAGLAWVVSLFWRTVLAK